MLWLLLLLPVTSSTWLDREPPLRSAPTPRAARTNVTEGYVNVRLDHFHAQNTDTFPMRYYYNSAFANNSNIVIFVGGEWEISEGWLRAGLPYELAEATGSGLFYTEHRYYGLTRPTQDTSVANLRYLNVDQALGDLAQFIQHIKSDDFENGRFKEGKVALIGCSYAGSMATWMRLGYPHVVDVAYSDSGPLLAQEDFPEYIETIARVILTDGGQACYSSLETAMTQVTALLNTTAGVQEVSELFNTCTTLSDSPLDRAAFFQGAILTPLAYLIQYAVEGDVEQVCARLTNASVSDSAMHRLAAWTLQSEWAQPCVETRYSEYVTAYTNTSFDSFYSTSRLWLYQTCVEYGWYQTTTGDDHPFLNTIPLEFYHQACKDFFNAEFNETRLRSGIERTNILWGGLSHLPDHTVTVQGGHDPWSPMGPNHTHATYLAPVYVVDGVSHCRALDATGQTDNEELERVKREVLNKLSSVLTGEVMFDSAPHATLTIFTAVISLMAVFIL